MAGYNQYGNPSAMEAAANARAAQFPQIAMPRNMQAAEQGMGFMPSRNAGQIQQIVNQGINAPSMPSQNGPGYVPTPYGAPAVAPPSGQSPYPVAPNTNIGVLQTPLDLSRPSEFNAIGADQLRSNLTQMPDNASGFGIPQTAPMAPGSGVTALDGVSDAASGSFLGNAWNGTKNVAGGVWEGIGGWDGINTGIQTATGVFQAYQGMKALELSEDQFEFNKESWNKNFKMQKDAYDRQVAQVESRKAFFTKDD